jgi:hypothetical protein
MYKHADIHYEPQHPMLKQMRDEQSLMDNLPEPMRISSDVFEASACDKVDKPKKPMTYAVMGSKKYDEALAKYERSERCAKIDVGVEAALKRISKEQLKLAKGKTLQGKLKEAIKEAAGGDLFGDKSAEDVLKALKQLKEVKMSVGKQKDPKSGKNKNIWVTFVLR